MANSATAAVPLARNAAANTNFQQQYTASDSKVSPLEKLYPRTLELWCSPAMCQAARVLAAMRTGGHDATRERSEDLGANRNAEADFRGLLAEMVIVLAAERWGLAPADFIFVSDRPVPGADFRINNYSYDVKTTMPGSRFLCCNERQRLALAHKGVDFLLPCAFPSPDQLAVYAPVPYADVAAWTLRKGQAGRQDYRSVPLETLKPITCLRQIAEVE